MLVMTRRQFESESNSEKTTKRSTALRAIDSALDDFHDVYDGGTENDIRDALLTLHTLVTKYQKDKSYRKTDSHTFNTARRKKRKQGLALLRIQIENALYHLPEESAQVRADLAFYDKLSGKDFDWSRFDELLGADLERLKLRVVPAEKESNDLSAELHAGVEEFLKTEGERLKSSDDYELSKLWTNIAGTNGSGGNPTRLAVIDLQTLLDGGKQPFIAFDGASLTGEETQAVWNKMRNPQDAVVGTYITQEQPVGRFESGLRKTLVEYVRTLLRGDLYDESRLIRAALLTERDYRGVIHLDYYASRSTAKNGLHKDTNGTNVFACLHYLNAEPIVGPEHIDDPGPIAVRTYKGAKVEGFYEENVYSKHRGWARMGAPWAKIADDKYVWPKALLGGLQLARGNRPTMEYSALPANGLVSFVDELIFHATPMLGQREQGAADERSLSAGATIPGTVKQTENGWSPNDGYINVYGAKDYGQRIQRRMSLNLSEEEKTIFDLPIPHAESGGLRRFWRLWMAITPAHWYRTLDVSVD
jgi:hypothetical protein